MKHTVQVFLLWSLIFIASKNVLSQSMSDEVLSSDKAQFGIRFDKPMYSAMYTKASPYSGVYQIYFANPLSSKFALIGDIPFVNTNYEIDYSYGGYNYGMKYQKHGFGNIFVGLKSIPQTQEEKSTISFGIYIPTAENPAIQGLLTDYYNISKFQYGLGLYYNYAYLKNNTEGLIYGIEAGPNLTIPTSYGVTSFYMHYAIQGGYQVNQILMKAELQGIFLFTGDYRDFADRSINMLNFGAEWRTGDISPQVFYKIYLKDYIRDAVDGVLGVGVLFTLDK